MTSTDFPGAPFARTLDELDPDTRDAFLWVQDDDDLRELGLPGLTFEEWKAERHV
jgi:hypothetical protein